MDWFAAHYLDGADVEPDIMVSPLLSRGSFGPATGAGGRTAGFDPLRDEGNRYALAMRDAGVLVDLREERSLTHAFATSSRSANGATATTAMISALRAHQPRLRSGQFSASTLGPVAKPKEPPNATLKAADRESATC